MTFKEFKDDIILKDDDESLRFLISLMHDNITDEIEIIYYAYLNSFTIKNHTRGYLQYVRGLSHAWQISFMLKCNQYLDKDTYNLSNQQLRAIYWTGTLEKTDGFHPSDRWYYLRKPGTELGKVNQISGSIAFLVSHIAKAWWHPPGEWPKFELPVAKNITAPPKSAPPVKRANGERIIFALIFEDGSEKLYTVTKDDDKWEFKNDTDEFKIINCTTTRDVVNELKSEWEHLIKVQVIVGEKFIRSETFITKGEK